MRFALAAVCAGIVFLGSASEASCPWEILRQSMNGRSFDGSILNLALLRVSVGQSFDVQTVEKEGGDVDAVTQTFETMAVDWDRYVALFKYRLGVTCGDYAQLQTIVQGESPVRLKTPARYFVLTRKVGVRTDENIVALTSMGWTVFPMSEKRPATVGRQAPTQSAARNYETYLQEAALRLAEGRSYSRQQDAVPTEAFRYFSAAWDAVVPELIRRVSRVSDGNAQLEVAQWSDGTVQNFGPGIYLRLTRTQPEGKTEQTVALTDSGFRLGDIFPVATGPAAPVLDPKAPWISAHHQARFGWHYTEAVRRLINGQSYTTKDSAPLSAFLAAMRDCHVFMPQVIQRLALMSEGKAKLEIIPPEQATVHVQSLSINLRLTRETPEGTKVEQVVFYENGFQVFAE